MAGTHIVVHYHELWLKGRNRDFFLHKLRLAIKRALEGLEVTRITQPGDRMVIELAPEADSTAALTRLERVSGISSFGIARAVDWRAAAGSAAEKNAAGSASKDELLSPIRDAAWEEIRSEQFATFAVRAKRSYKGFPVNAMAIEREVGGYLFDKLRAEGREIRVRLNHPELTCRIEVTPGPALIYARRHPGAGGLPANTAGRLICLLSGGFDSAVAAFKMMKRGAHVSFVHFWGGGARAGESSVHVARELVKRLVPWEFTTKLYVVPFEPLQREIVRRAPEKFRILLYRRLMLRIAERVAGMDQAKGLITGDSLGQVASQTIQNMAAVGAATKLPIYRPLVGDDKLEILEIARKIGTHDTSAEPFHDCCPMFLPKAPALFASPEELDEAEASLGVEELVERGIESLTLERYHYAEGIAEQVESFLPVTPTGLGSTRKATA